MTSSWPSLASPARASAAKPLLALAKPPTARLDGASLRLCGKRRRASFRLALPSFAIALITALVVPPVPVRSQVAEIPEALRDATFEVVLEDDMALAPGVTAEDLLGAEGFNRHVKTHIAATLTLPEGNVRPEEVTLQRVEILEDQNRVAANAHGDWFYGKKRLRCTTTVLIRLQELVDALDSEGKEHEGINYVFLAGAQPSQRVYVRRPFDPNAKDAG